MSSESYVEKDPQGVYLAALEEELASYQRAGEKRADDVKAVEAEIERVKKARSAARRSS